jgi:RNA polymerase sigma factor (sigma-70 family)
MIPFTLEPSLARLAEDAVPDDLLLARFVAGRDEAAFAALVRRHGPMVLGVCRRLVGDLHLAEDAFQASFLVLARKAALVRPADALAGWLHGVARKSALEVRARRRRLLAREGLVAAVPDRAGVAPVGLDPDLGAWLDLEVARLPQTHRAAVVLCELEGRSRREAARLLGIPEGTLSSRLAGARKRLAVALRRRGVVLPVAGLAAVSLPAGLTAAAVAVVTAPRTVVAPVAALAAGVSRMIGVTKFKTLPALALGALTLGAVLLLWPSTGAALPQDRRPSPPAAQALGHARAGEILIWTKGKALLLKPNGTVVRSWAGDQVPDVGAARLSPDGQRIAVLRITDTRTLNSRVNAGGGQLLATVRRHLFKITIYPVADRLEGRDVPLPGDSVQTVFWAADGHRLFASSHDDDHNLGHTHSKKNRRHWALDARTFQATPLALPAEFVLWDAAPDGSTFLMLCPSGRPFTDHWLGHLVRADGRPPVCINNAGEFPYDLKFSPDGRRVLGAGIRAAAGAPARPDGPAPAGPPLVHASRMWFDTITLVDKKRQPVVNLPAGEYVNQCRWSPDGRRVLYVQRAQPHDFANQQDTVTVNDARGGQARGVLTLDHGPYPLWIDWR